MEFEGKLALVTGRPEIALLPAPPPTAENRRCPSCGSPRHQLCARLGVGDELVLRIRRSR